MQYHLDTIPVWEAMEWKLACPLCGLQHKTEDEVVERTLGASVMEPDVRIEVNRKGICARHQTLLYARQNRLGHALLMDSHTQEQLANLQKIREQIRSDHPRKSSLFGGRDATGTLIQNLKALTAHCVVCELVETHMTRYEYTFLHLFKTSEEFRIAWKASNGVCLPHAIRLLEAAKQHLTAEQQLAFATEALDFLIGNLTTDQKDLDWFTRKFDYRNQSEPWGNSKTALERAVNRLRGWCLGDAPYPRKK